jgi:hypothetical protein
MDQMAEAIRKIQKHAGDLAGGTPFHAPRPGPATRGLT